MATVLDKVMQSAIAYLVCLLCSCCISRRTNKGLTCGPKRRPFPPSLFLKAAVSKVTPREFNLLRSFLHIRLGCTLGSSFIKSIKYFFPNHLLTDYYRVTKAAGYFVDWSCCFHLSLRDFESHIRRQMLCPPQSSLMVRTKWTKAVVYEVGINTS